MSFELIFFRPEPGGFVTETRWYSRRAALPEVLVVRGTRPEFGEMKLGIASDGPGRHGDRVLLLSLAWET